MSGIKILGTGHYVPDRIMTNADFEKIVDTSDEWITTRTGIKQRHFAAEGEIASDMAVKACERAIEAAGIDKSEIGLLICSTVTEDKKSPSTACIVAQKLGITHPAISFDINAACTGFVYGLTIAEGLIDKLPTGKYGLVFGTELLSSTIDMTDRSTCVLFGDGSGAVVIERDENRVFSSYLTGIAEPEYLGIDQKEDNSYSVYMDGQSVFKRATTNIALCAETVMQQANVTLDDIALVICHQANLRIIDFVKKKLKVPDEKCYVNIHNYGNTSSASIAIALDEAVRSGKVKSGDKVLLSAFGAGFVFGALLIEI